MEETSENVTKTYTDPITGKFIEGNPGGGRPKETEEQKLIKKASKELISEYKEALAQSLPFIQPVIIAKAMEGDMIAIKEIHDRTMDKSKQSFDTNIKAEVNITNLEEAEKEAIKALLNDKTGS